MIVCERPLRGTATTATGTDAGWQRHHRRKEQACPPCAHAHSRHSTAVQQANPGAHRAANLKWRASRPGYFGQYQRARLEHDVTFRLVRLLRKRLWSAVRGCESSTLALLGCGVTELRHHLEAQFQPGMTWENYGLGGWEVDHVRPVAGFDLTDPRQVARCFHFTNLQPLWAAQNRAKGTKDCFVRAALEP